MALLCAIAFTFGFVTAVAREIPKLDPTHQVEAERDGYIYANDGKTILAVLRGNESRVIVEPDQIAPMMKHAIVAIEDKRFYEHQRRRPPRHRARALGGHPNKSVVQGGSTITQQFVKNAIVRDDRTISAQAQGGGARLAARAAARTKDRILTAYLNTIYFGNGAYGVQQAALTYFGHGARTLTLPEAALLAGIPADPSRYDPVANPRERARSGATSCCARCSSRGRSRARDMLAATAAPLPEAGGRAACRRSTAPVAPYFANYVKQQLVDEYGAAQGLRRRAAACRRRSTSRCRRRRARRSRSGCTNPNGPTAALVAIDPRDGRVLAMVGGENFRESQFNLAVQGERQPGSAFKPFVLATALQQGIAPATTFESKPLLDLARRPHLAGAQLRGRVPRLRSTSTRRPSTPTTPSTRS